MKILFVSLFLPQERAYHAGSRYVYEILKGLSEKHEVHLAMRLEEKETPGLEALKPLCKEIYPFTYKSAEKRGSFEIIRLILNYIGFGYYADWLARRERFDLIQVEWVEAALMIRKRNTPMVLNAHDVITKVAERRWKNSTGVRRLPDYLAYRIIKAIELRIMRKFNLVFTLSSYDRDYLLSMTPRIKVKVISPPAGLDITARCYERKKNMILFFASYKYRRVNVDAAMYFYRSVFPAVRKSVPDAKLIIAGYGPPEGLTSLQDNDPHVLVTGFIEDTDEYYKKASVFVAPILVGGGIIVKILDAMAAGTPVVSTSYGNEGIGAVPGRDLIIADDPESFASGVVRILRDEEFSSQLGRNGQEFVEIHYTLDAVMSKIESTYKELVGLR